MRPLLATIVVAQPKRTLRTIYYLGPAPRRTTPDTTTKMRCINRGCLHVQGNTTPSDTPAVTRMAKAAAQLCDAARGVSMQATPLPSTPRDNTARQPQRLAATPPRNCACHRDAETHAHTYITEFTYANAKHGESGRGVTRAPGGCGRGVAGTMPTPPKRKGSRHPHI
jgi:hypothetical protein